MGPGLTGLTVLSLELDLNLFQGVMLAHVLFKLVIGFLFQGLCQSRTFFS